jgi:outer membrane receptor protein involved in Fe transport
MIDLGNEQHMMAIRQPISTKSLYLYLEDGIPIRPNGVFNHNALLEMNMAATENVEVIKGPYSALYGGEAIGGSINFITQKPTKKLTGKVGLRGDGYGYLRADVKVSTTLGKTGVYLSAYKSTIEDGISEYGDYDKLAITGKITHAFTDNLNWSNTITYVDYFSEMSGNLEQEQFENEDYTSNHTFTFRDAKSLRFNSTLNKSWNENNTSILTFVFRDNTMGQNPSYRISDRTDPDSYTSGELNENSFNSYAAYFQHNIKLDVLKSNIMFGANIDFSPKEAFAKILEVYRNADGVFESYTDTGNFKSNYETDIINTGFYVMGDAELFENFKVNAGLRYDIYSYDFKNNIDDASDFSSLDAKETYNSVTPRIGLVFNPTNNIGFYTNYSVGFIPPSISERLVEFI